MMYDSLSTLGAVASDPFGSPDAWGNYLGSLRDALKDGRTRAVSAYNTLKQVRSNLGLPFMGGAGGEAGGDQGAWPADYEQQAVDILAMTKVFANGVDDVLSGKRKLMWDDKLQDMAIEGSPGDPLRLQYDASGLPVLVGSSGYPTHASGQVGIAPIVLATGALALVSGVAIGVLVYQGLKTIETVAEQKTQKTVAETAGKHADLVAQGKATPADAAKLNQSLYSGATELAKATGEAKKREQETSDIASAVKTIAWVGLGVGILYVVAQALKGGALAMPALAGARDNPPREPADEVAVRELELYLENDRRFSPDSPEGQGRAISKNLWLKWKKGKYDASRAPQAWSYVVESAAKAYAKEFASPSDWSRIFTPATRALVAKSLAESWETKAREGEFDRFPPSAAA